MPPRKRVPVRCALGRIAPAIVAILQVDLCAPCLRSTPEVYSSLVRASEQTASGRSFRRQQIPNALRRVMLRPSTAAGAGGRRAGTVQLAVAVPVASGAGFTQGTGSMESNRRWIPLRANQRRKPLHDAWGTTLRRASTNAVLITMVLCAKGAEVATTARLGTAKSVPRRK